MRMKRSYVALMLGLLAVAAVVGIALAGSKAEPAPQSTSVVSRILTVPASSCYPQDDLEMYDNYGRYLRGDSGTGLQSFICPVNFPEYASPHRIKAITLYCYDQNGSTGAQYDVVAQVARTEPSLAKEVLLGTVRSTGSSATNPKAWTISGTQIKPKRVTPGQAVYLWVSFAGSSNLKLYGFKIRYTIP